MPLIDFEGNPIEKGASITDERTITVDVAQPTVEMSGLVAVDEVVNVSVGGEEVNEDNDLVAESTSVSENTVDIQFYNGSGTGGIDTADDGDVTSQEITVTASGI